ncbi:hypothetical protein FNV43_RR01314 [Rhamnella rubrinervis]|uniref:Uncharacterized protein n=1 Tax=Rhamnella rubrinervis TaxID=2594499 RepID=A0A8K0HS30_9ROSA|nr:hypothetical protein FNV43_RR01314 [Rhamnella rubrinervis]
MNHDHTYAGRPERGSSAYHRDLHIWLPLECFPLTLSIPVMVSPKSTSGLGAGPEGKDSTIVLPHLMGQLFSLLSDWVRGRRNPPVEEPVPVRMMTPLRESSTGSCEGRISQRGDSRTDRRGREDPGGSRGGCAEDTEEDPEEDSLGTDEYVPHGYTPDPVDPEDFDPWDEPASD